MAAVTVWPSEDAVEDKPAHSESPLLGVIVEQVPGGPDADRGASDVHGIPDDGWREVALSFARDLAGHDGDHEAWHRRLARWVTPALAESYLHTDVRLLPPQGHPRVLAWWGAPGVVESIVEDTEDSRLVMTLERRQADQPWVVTRAEPAESWEAASRRLDTR
jgi:hypothetical protein